MQRLGVYVAAYDPRTAQETVDLALAAGLLEIEVWVFIDTHALAHLNPADADTEGRWRTLLDFCPARVLIQQEADPTASASYRISAEPIEAEQWQALQQQCDRMLLG